MPQSNTETPDTTKTPDELRPDILDAALPHVQFDGWSETALAHAADDLGIDQGIVKLAFPGGPVEVIAAFSARADERMTAQMADMAGDTMKIRDRITRAVRMRIEENTPYREAARRALALLALPIHATSGIAILNNTVDAIWRAAGDRSTDYNYYTKRMILAGVFSATMLYWLNDEGENPDDPWADTWAFLDRRIDDVMKIEKTKASMKGQFGKLPDVWGCLGRLRYARQSSARP